MLAGFLPILNTPEEQADFAALYARCGARAMALARRILKDAALAEDAVHDGFAYLADHYQRLKDGSPEQMERYLFQCVESRALNAAALRQRETVWGADPPELPDGGPEPEGQTEQADRLARAVAAMERLPAGYRAILELACTGWTPGEIAEILGLSPAVVQKRLERARKTVRKEVDGEDA